MQKKSMPFKFVLVLLFVLNFVFPVLVLADAPPTPEENKIGNYGLEQTAGVANLDKTENRQKKLPELISNVVGAALAMIGIVFFILILYGGITWMTAHGKEDQVEKGRDAIIEATIGLIIVVGAYALTQFVLKSVGIAEETPATPPGAQNDIPGNTPGTPAGGTQTCGVGLLSDYGCYDSSICDQNSIFISSLTNCLSQGKECCKRQIYTGT